jgi:hypothetical protein
VQPACRDISGRERQKIAGFAEKRRGSAEGAAVVLTDPVRVVEDVLSI